MSQEPENVAYDFDGTIAYYDHFRGAEHLGDPIPEAIKRLKDDLKAGKRVWIHTARVYPGLDYERGLDATISYLLIADWCKRHVGEVLPITCFKLPIFARFNDDRATEFVPNEGVPVSEMLEEA